MKEAKFFVMDPTADETAQQVRPLDDDRSAFDGFPKLKQAVRYILSAEDNDNWPTPAREILDENGDTVEVDWDADEYKTRDELARERDRAKAATIAARDARLRIEKAHLEYQKKLIDTGLIPIDLLNDFIVDIHLKSEPMFDNNLSMYSAHVAGAIQYPERVTVDIKFQMAAQGTAAHYALDKLVNHKR